MDGIRIESLPLSSSNFTFFLPRTKGRSLGDYLAHMVITIDHLTTPALFHPRNARQVRTSRATDVHGIDATAVCTAGCSRVGLTWAVEGVAQSAPYSKPEFPIFARRRSPVPNLAELVLILVNLSSWLLANPAQHQRDPREVLQQMTLRLAVDD